MPHNWASAECVLYLRHLLALEDGPVLRLFEGIGREELKAGEPFEFVDSPTRFGRVSLRVEPLDRKRGWRATFRRGSGPAPAAVRLPLRLAGAGRLENVNVPFQRAAAGVVGVDPTAPEWTAVWRG
jgi:hypothetical protein